MFSIVLVEPEIPPNTGSIGRTCVATCCPLHLVGPLGFSLEDRYLKRAGLDYWEHVDLHVHNSWNAFLEWKKHHENPARLILFTKKADQIYTDFEFRSGDFLVFGKETQGLSDELLKCGLPCLKIPTPGAVRSLNLSVAAGVALYEALRQTRTLA